MKLLGRNYFTLEKISPDEMKVIEKAHNKMMDIGIIRIMQDSENLKRDKDDQKLEITESFDYYLKDSLREIFWYFDFATRKPKKFSNPKMTKKAKRAEEEYENMHKEWVDEGGDSDYFHEFFNIGIITNIIIEFKVIQDIGNRIREKNPNITNPIDVPPEKFQKHVDLEIQNLTEEEKQEYGNMARTIYGMNRYLYESSADKILSKRLVHYEIMTDTGHLTRYFMDIIKTYAKDYKLTLEQIADGEDEGLLVSLVIEGTREEDFDNMEEYLDKKSKIEMNEYYEMARIVGRMLKMELVKQREELQ